MTVTINHVWYTNFGNGSSTGYYAVTPWAATTAVTAGQLKRQLATPAVGSERVFVAIVAGTTGSVEATWVITKGAKTTDGTVTWMECTGLPAMNGDAVNTPLSSANRSGAQVLGNVIQNNAGTFYFICTTAGTTGASEPTYVTTIGGNTVDSGCTWTCIAAVGGYAAWIAPFARTYSSCTVAQGWTINGDTIYVASIHAETATTSLNGSWTLGTLNTPCSVYCVSNTSYNPPLSSDVVTVPTASFTQTGAGVSLSIVFWADIYGFIFAATGSGSSVTIGSNNAVYLRLRNCRLVNNTSPLSIGYQSGAGNSYVEMMNTVLALGGGYAAMSGIVIWRDTPVAALTGNFLFGATVWGGGAVFFEGLDLSATLATNLFGGITNSANARLVVSGCKLPTGTVGVSSNGSPVAGQVDIINCDSGSATYRHERWWSQGGHVVDTTAVRTGGSSDGATALAWRITTLSTANYIVQFECMPITTWWTSAAGVTGTVTLQGAWNGAALPFNDQIWMDVRCFGVAGSTALTANYGGKANALVTHTAQTVSVASWDSIAVTRLNNTAYLIGNYFRLAGNPGQLFICVTSGTSNASQPVAYTGVADGVSVTDGGAVFRALVRFSMSLTLSPLPQVPGFIRCYVRVGLGTSQFWIDPLITLS